MCGVAAIVKASDLGSLDDAALDALLVGLQRERAVLDAAELAVIAEHDRRGHVVDVRMGPHVSPAAARAKQRLAVGVLRLPGAVEKLWAGEVSAAHLRPLVELRDRLSDEQVVELLVEAERVDPSRISRRAHRRATPVPDVKPEGSVSASVRGGTTFRFDYSVLDAEVVRNALDAIIDERWRAEHPQREQAKAARDPWGQRLAEALLELCRRSLAGTVGRGSAKPSLHVVIDYQLLWDLATTHGVCETLDGRAVPVGEVRRLLADANIIPYVLGGDSEVIDFGRARRLFSPKQKQAMRVRDATCLLGCDVDSRYIQAHHNVKWADGGHTDLDNSAGLCPHCHKLCDIGWRVVIHHDHIETYDPDGRLHHTRQRGRRKRPAA